MLRRGTLWITAFNKYGRSETIELITKTTLSEDKRGSASLENSHCSSHKTNPPDFTKPHTSAPPRPDKSMIMQVAAKYDAMRDNNRAVSLMLSGRVEEAIPLLSRALEITKKSMMVFSEDKAEGDTSSPHHDRITLDQNMNVGCFVPTYSEQDSCHPDEEHSYYIYSKGIRIERSSLPCSHGSMIIYSTIIIFNLALAFHLSALSVSHRKRGAASLRKALQLYGLALTLQEKEQVKGNLFFTLAAVNNMGVIQRLLGESEKKTHEYFEYVLSNLLPLFACGEQATSPLTAFLHNAISVLNAGSSSAPAA